MKSLTKQIGDGIAVTKNDWITRKLKGIRRNEEMFPQIRSLVGKKVQGGHLHVDGQVISGDQEKTEVFREVYEEIYRERTPDNELITEIEQ